jgi:serine O-acetyltransferase
VPAHCTSVGVPGRNICRPPTKTCPLEPREVAAENARAICPSLVSQEEMLHKRITILEKQIQQLTQNQLIQNQLTQNQLDS